MRDKSVEQVEMISNKNQKFERGREYYLSEKDMEVSKIRNHINDVRKRIYKIKNLIKEIGVSKDETKTKLIIRHLSLLTPSIRTLYKEHEEIDKTKYEATKMAAKEMEEKISRWEIKEAKDILERLSYYVDEITKKMSKKITEIRN